MNETDLEVNGNLNGEIKEKVEQFLADSDGFLMLVKTNSNKVIGFFIPSNFKEKLYKKSSNPLLVFYWINKNSELVTS